MTQASLLWGIFISVCLWSPGEVPSHFFYAGNAVTTDRYQDWGAARVSPSPCLGYSFRVCGPDASWTQVQWVEEEADRTEDAWGVDGSEAVWRLLPSLVLRSRRVAMLGLSAEMMKWKITYIWEPVGLMGECAGWCTPLGRGRS